MEGGGVGEWGFKFPPRIQISLKNKLFKIELQTFANFLKTFKKQFNVLIF